MTTTHPLGTRVAVAALVSLAVVTASAATYAFTRPELSLAQLAPSTDSVSFFAEAAASESGAQNTAYVDSTVSDVLPNHLYEVGGDQITLSSGLFVGRIVGVESGGTSGTVSSITVTMAAEQAFGSRTTPGDVDFSVQLPTGTTVEEARTTLVGSGLFVVITSTDQSFPATPEAPSVYRDGALILPVDDGRLIAPKELGSAYLGDLTTLDDLVAAAEAPDVVRPIRAGHIVED